MNQEQVQFMYEHPVMHKEQREPTIEQSKPASKEQLEGLVLMFRHKGYKAVFNG